MPVVSEEYVPELSAHLRQMPEDILHVRHRSQASHEAAASAHTQALQGMPGDLVNWQCICGNFVKEKRFCPKCKLVRFSINRSPVLCYSGLSLGTLENGLPFLFPIDYFSNHILISGQTGTGKSRFAFNLAIKTANYPLPSSIKLLIIDVEGEWKNIIPNLKEKTDYYDVASNLRINPFDLKDPALIRELFRQTVFKGIEEEYVDLSAQMNFVLQEVIAESNNMQELIQKIKDYNRQKLTGLDKTKTALLVRLDPFLRSPLKEIFACKKSNPDFNKLGDVNTIIDLHALDSLVAYNSELRLIYNLITTYFLRKMLGREPTDAVSNLFIADEAQLLVPKILHKLIVTESFPATEIATRLRKRGCGLLLITQSPSNLEPDIVKNSATKITFRLQDQQDVKLIADSAGFVDIAEYEYLSDNLVRLPKRKAIVCTSEQEPFLVTAENLELTQFNQTTSLSEPAEQTEVLTIEEPDPDENAFLDSIRNEPFLSVTERRVKLGWNYRKYVSVVDNLLKQKKIERMSVKLGRGSPKILYQEAGQVPSVRHQYYVWWIAGRLQEKGYSVKKNSIGPDIEIKDGKIAIEVELGKSNIHGNIRNDLQQFDKVIVCSDDRKLLQTLSREIKENGVLFLPVERVPALFEKKNTRSELMDI